VEGQARASAQPLDQRATTAPSPDIPAPTASLQSFPGAPDFACAPRGPRRAGTDGPGARSAAKRFGLDWTTAAPAVLAVAAEASARVPEEWEIEGPGISLSLGDAADLDPDLLEAMLGPDGLGGQALGPQFGQDAAADALRPGPILAALTEQAVAGAATLTDDQLTGALQAARRLEARAQWQQTTLVAEYARRRAAQAADAKARGIPKGRRPGEFPDDELASELLITRNQAAGRIEADLELTARLPRTYAGMANGTITAGRADTIAAATGFLSDEDAARADEILAAAAPGLRVDQLGRKAAALEMKLDPEAARIRKEHAKSTRQRVELRRELSGNASIAGRELDTATALACKANIDAIAVRLRNHGHLDGTLSSIKALVLTELLQGRDPIGLIHPGPSRRSRPAADDPAEDGRLGSGPEHPEHPDYPCCPDDPDDPGPDDPDSPDGPRYAGPAGRPGRDADEAENARYDGPGTDDPDAAQLALTTSRSSSGSSSSPPSPSPGASATTATPKTTTPPAANSSTSCAPAPKPATPPAATPKRSTAIRTTPPPGPTAPRTSATSDRNADATTAANKHPAGASSNPNPASSAGPSPAAASTPPRPPSTTSNIPATPGILVGHPTPLARPNRRDDR
jgi:hypothetical protein